MIFSDFKSMDAALTALQLDSRTKNFVQPVPHIVPSWVRDRLDLVCSLGYPTSECGVGEGLIFPVILEAWTNYGEMIKVWPRPELNAGDLRGNPDYVFSRIPGRGYMRFMPPYACIVEAKQEKFQEGWGLCIAAMVAAQRLNAPLDLPIYGAVTIGKAWEFGRLHDQTFEFDPQSFTMGNLDRMVGAVRYLFEEGKKYPVPVPLKHSA